MYVFDKQSEFFRYPQGGIKTNDEITLKIYIKKSNLNSPKIKIEKRNNYNNEFYKEVPMEWCSTEKSYDLYIGTFKIEELGHYYYSFIFDETTERYELLIYENYTTPDWIKGGIIYHIFVDRFYKKRILKKDGDIIISDWGKVPNHLPDEFGEIKNNEFFGGNLEGIKEKLPYISSLGVTALYLSPIFKSSSNHKYDTGDYFSLDPMFGDENSFKDLCNEAKKYGINIILDGVFSHTGDDSIYFNKYGNYHSIGAYESKDSPYFQWYMFNNWNNDYVCWWGIKTLPTVNKDNKNYQEFIAGENGVLKYWQKLGAKGWRLDVADELPNNFIEKLRTAVKEQDKDAYLVGEVWEDASNKFSYGVLKEYFCGKQLDSVTNYPLRNAIIEYVKNKNCHNLYNTMNFIIEKYPPQTINCLMNIIGTHDTARILTLLGCDQVPESKDERALYKLNGQELKKGIKLLKIASLLQFTLPGVPCIYYGDEAGLEGFEDPFNRACYPWGKQNKEIFNHYKFLSELRKNKVFAEGKYKCLVHDGGVFVFERYNKAERIIIAINMSEETITLNGHNLNSEDYLIL